MLIKLLFSAMGFGAAAVALAVTFGFSFWTVFLIYSFVGSSALIVGGFFVASHAPASAQKIEFGGVQLKSADIHVRS